VDTSRGTLAQDGDKAARVKPTVGVKQGCPSSSLLFSFYINDIGMIAEGVQGAVTSFTRFKL